MRVYFFLLLILLSFVSLTALAQSAEEPPLTDDALSDEIDTALTWICRYSRDNGGTLVLSCHANNGRQVLIPIWNYDYDDGLVDSLMQAALCRESDRCVTWLRRRA